MKLSQVASKLYLKHKMRYKKAKRLKLLSTNNKAKDVEIK